MPWGEFKKFLNTEPLVTQILGHQYLGASGEGSHHTKEVWAARTKATKLHLAGNAAAAAVASMAAAVCLTTGNAAVAAAAVASAVCLTTGNAAVASAVASVAAAVCLTTGNAAGASLAAAAGITPGNSAVASAVASAATSTGCFVFVYFFGAIFVKDAICILMEEFGFARNNGATNYLCLVAAFVCFA